MTMPDDPLLPDDDDAWAEWVSRPAEDRITRAAFEKYTERAFNEGWDYGYYDAILAHGDDCRHLLTDILAHHDVDLGGVDPTRDDFITIGLLAPGDDDAATDGSRSLQDSSIPDVTERDSGHEETPKDTAGRGET
jgi:hypothetical protein